MEEEVKKEPQYGFGMAELLAPKLRYEYNRLSNERIIRFIEMYDPHAPPPTRRQRLRWWWQQHWLRNGLQLRRRLDDAWHAFKWGVGC
jgi:hypothetical protein